MIQFEDGLIPDTIVGVMHDHINRSTHLFKVLRQANGDVVGVFILGQEVLAVFTQRTRIGAAMTGCQVINRTAQRFPGIFGRGCRNGLTFTRCLFGRWRTLFRRALSSFCFPLFCLLSFVSLTWRSG